MSLRRQFSAFPCLKAGRKLQQLRVEMIDCKLPIIKRTTNSCRVLAMVKLLSDAACYIERPRNAYKADRIQPVRILQDPCFQSLRHNPAGETVRFDRMHDRPDMF